MIDVMSCLAVLLASSALCAAAENGLVAHYTFEEGPGGSVKDASGNGNDGKIIGDVDYVPLPDGKGHAMRFNAGKAHVDCGRRAGLAVRDAVTIELWFYPEVPPAGGTDAGLVSTGLGSYALTYVAGGCWWYVAGAADGGDAARLDVNGGALRPSSTWRHVAATFDGKTSRVYVDGELTGTGAFDGRRKIAPGGPLCLRYPLLYGSDEELPFACMMDDVRIYNRALSDDELRRHYRKERGRRQGRKATVGEMSVTTRVYTKLSKLRAEVDFAGLRPLPEKATLTVELVAPTSGKVVGRHQTGKLPTSDRLVAVFDTSEVPAGDYVVKTTARDGSGKQVASVSTVQVALSPAKPTRPEGDEGTRSLNNLVTELLNVQGPERAPHRQYRFINPRKGWIFISSDAIVKDGGGVWIVIDSRRKEDAAITHRPGGRRTLEAMRHLPAGAHTLNVYSHRAHQSGLVVRAIPEIVYAEVGYRPSTFLPGLGPYTWEFLERIALPDNLNVVLERNPGGPHAEQWRQMGKKVLTHGTTYLLRSNSAEGAYEYWSALDGFERPDRDGIMFDELSGESNIEWYAALSDGVRKLSENPQYADKVLYPYCVLMYTSEPSTTFCWEIVEAGYKLAEEKYMPEQPTLAAARSFLDDSLTRMMSRYRAAIPNCQEHMIVVLGYMSAPPETLNTMPSVDYKVYLDMQFHLLANDPEFKGLYGVMCYHSAFADEEILRWSARLFRHYCIEGNRERLSTDPYVLPHLRNPDFADGRDGWAFSPAEPGSIDTRDVRGYSYLQGRYPPTPHGDTVLWTKRSAKGPNRVSQRVKRLVPGRLYSLKMFTAEYQRFVTGKGVASFEAVEAKREMTIGLDGVDSVPAKSFRNTFASGRASHGRKEFDRRNNLPITYHFIVFRARGEEATLTISDWADADDPGGPIGRELMCNFLELQPYLED